MRIRSLRTRHLRTPALRVVALFAALAFLVPLVSVVGATPARALSAANFDPGYIISDGVFSNSGAMSEAQIQSFLEAQVPTCAGAGGVACLRDYLAPSITRAASPGGQCGAYAGADSERASRILFKVAQSCQINPQVLIVLLQKEQGLITAVSPTPGKYRIAMGYGCPDTAPCDAQYFGFANQVYKAAWQFREYMIDPGDWRYGVGVRNVQYHPNIDCKASAVTIRNQATAALYNYTPYQPNAAALANLSGSGDSCSSYGNRNFWVYFSNWFGSPVGLVNPIGVLDSLTGSAGQVTLSGWSFDPDTTAPIQVNVYLNGVVSATLANLARPDVAAAYPGSGDNHGFTVTLPVATAGLQTACIYGINQGPGVNTFLGCQSVTAKSGPPFGVVDSVTADPQRISASGWAIDPDTQQPVTVQLSLDGVVTNVVADQGRPDVAAVFRGYGAAHGFSASVAASAGPHTLCISAVNLAGPGGTTRLGCANVTVPGGTPFGFLDSVSVNAGVLTVSGWSIDPDSAGPIPVHLYLDGKVTGYAANRSRPDVGAAYPGYGAAHGFAESMPVSAGKHTVCVYAINIAGAGDNPLLGCRSTP